MNYVEYGKENNDVTVDCFMRQKINELSRIMTSQADDIFTCLPEYFLDKDVVVSQAEKHEKNVFIDSLEGVG